MKGSGVKQLARLTKKGRRRFKNNRDLTESPEGLEGVFKVRGETVSKYGHFLWLEGILQGYEKKYFQVIPSLPVGANPVGGENT